jgi:uncharacterized protein
MELLVEIGRFILQALGAIWPYLLITIPLAVAVQMSGAARYINRAFQARPLAAIVLATAVGAFSPFCSCSVIPVVASLLIGGVPLAPVMSFWIASPSMDPEIFFLSVAMLDWPLAAWRMAATLALSLGAGFITHLAYLRGWLPERVLRRDYSTAAPGLRELLRAAWQKTRGWWSATAPAALATTAALTAGAEMVSGSGIGVATGGCESGQCTIGAGSRPSGSLELRTHPASNRASFSTRLINETVRATTMVLKFMLLAFFLEALIVLFVPESWVLSLLGPGNPLAIPTAALLGVPFYTSNLSALPMIGGLLAQGMEPAAALAFLIAGPTTTLPAMAAVFGLTIRRVFALYVAFSLLGAVALGYLFSVATIG